MSAKIDRDYFPALLAWHEQATRASGVIMLTSAQFALVSLGVAELAARRKSEAKRLANSGRKAYNGSPLTERQNYLMRRELDRIQRAWFVSGLAHDPGADWEVWLTERLAAIPVDLFALRSEAQWRRLAARRVGKN